MVMIPLAMLGALQLTRTTLSLIPTTESMTGGYGTVDNYQKSINKIQPMI